jgi:hypothetical protein
MLMFANNRCNVYPQMEETYYSEMLTTTRKPTWRHNVEDHNPSLNSMKTLILANLRIWFNDAKKLWVNVENVSSPYMWFMWKT